eukprot:Clim_evm38s240 gene=Clim_evmTU38s240
MLMAKTTASTLIRSSGLPSRFMVLRSVAAPGMIRMRSTAAAASLNTDAEEPVEVAPTTYRAGQYTISVPADAHFRRTGTSNPVTHKKFMETDSNQDQALAAINGDKYKIAGGPEFQQEHVWSPTELHGVEITHKDTKDFTDQIAFSAVEMVRSGFDWASGYTDAKLSVNQWLTRIIFLETTAAVPGMVAGALRHFQSLRRMEREGGYLHTFLEEAENERMHLMTALAMKRPGAFFKLAVLGAQGIFTNMFALAYFTSPRFCHRFVGYLEEEAVKTYTRLLGELDEPHLEEWATQPAPQIAVDYWRLNDDATVKDVILAIRADEAHHRVHNHTFSDMLKLGLPAEKI